MLSCRCLLLFLAHTFLLPVFSISQIDSLYSDRTLESLENRFRHSLQITKDLYEKILALDHHLAGLKAQRDVFQLANPQSYPQFATIREELENDLKNRYQVDMPGFLEQNAVISGAWTLVSLLLSDNSPEEKSKSLQEISCLLDFTMRIQNDLTIIHYETEFLREANAELRNQCEMLFEESGAVLQYDKSLESCRREDDWETVFGAIHSVFENMALQSTRPDLRSFSARTQNTIAFRIDRTEHFIQEYSNMISQGLKYYQKFEKILARYETKTLCVEQLPVAFTQLKQDVQFTLEKFRHAYQLPELRGSKLKALMYGMD